MTKQIRVENACTSSFKVVVEVWDKGQEGAPDHLAETIVLGHPTALAERYITSTRYIVVKEAAA